LRENFPLPQTFKYWRPDGRLYDVAPGIEIIATDTNYDDVDWNYDRERRSGYPESFAEHAASNLTYLYSTQRGRTILTHILNSGHTLTIGFAINGNSARALNVQNSMTDVAYEIYSTNRPGERCKAALIALNFGPGRFRLFAELINAQPEWNLDSRPGSTGGIWALGQRWIDFLQANSSDDFSNKKFIVSDDVGEWSSGHSAIDYGPAKLVSCLN
jgi:hypothetical protein